MLIVHLGRRTVHAQAFMNEGCQGSDVYKIISPCLWFVLLRLKIVLMRLTWQSLNPSFYTTWQGSTGQGAEMFLNF